MNLEIQPTDFVAHRRFLEEAERVMFIDAGMARPDDEKKLLRLVRDSLNSCRNKVDRGQGAGFCGFESGEPIGCVYATVNGLEQNAFITCVYVRECYRDKGVGRTLLNRLLEHLNGHGIHNVGLAVTATNDRALHLYRSMGFDIRRHIMRRVTQPEEITSSEEARS